MHASGENDRRRSARASVGLELHLVRKVGQPVTARTLDIGTGGARVTCERPLRIDEELRFDVELPERRHLIGGTARVLRQRRHDVYALRFEGIAPAALGELRAFVEATERTPVL